MKGMLSPSLMCADLLNLQSDISALDSAGAEYIHLDFMDGVFVPNITLDASLIKKVKNVLVNMRRDIHIMAYKPEKYFDLMEIGCGDIVSVHFEACDDVRPVLKEIRNRNALAFLAISPNTSAEIIKDYLDDIDGVLVMTVYPGFAGQPIVDGSMQKIADVRKIIDDNGKEIILEVDGHVSWDLCGEMKKNGADLFVAGSSSIFSGDAPLGESVKRMRALIS